MAFYALRKVSDSPVSVAATSTTVLAANEQRKYALIINTSNTDIWLRLGGTAVVGQGIFIARSGFAYEIDVNNLFVGQITAIHGGTGNKTLSVLEMS